MAINAILTTQADPNPGDGIISQMVIQDVVKWLESDRMTHLAVVTSSDGQQVAIWCGADGGRADFHLQALPLDDIEDESDGGDLTAQEAILEALLNY